jgi:hypothetical protein
MTLKQPFSGFVMSAWRQLSPRLVIIVALALTVVARPGEATWGKALPERLQQNQQDTVPLDPEDPEDLAPETEQPDSETVAPIQPPLVEESPLFLRPQNACPQNLEPLVNRLLQDLPTYTELVAARSLDLRAGRDSPFGTVITASQPDYQPIELTDTPYGDSPRQVQQVFFTTLERQYWQGEAFSLQNYHWLFLAEASNGWYLSQMYSSIGSYPADALDAPSPPQESSEGIVGQAVTLWLRDCRAGAVFPPEGELQEEMGR